ncbi:MAG: restriction endonuclease subunit S [Cellulophaga sp.]
MEDIKKVPALRFPEFSGEWEVKKLGKIAELTSSKRVYLSDYVENGIPFYRGKEISEIKNNKIPSDILYITKKSYNYFKSKYGVPVENDILITAVGTLGNVLRIRDNEKFYFKDGNLIWLKKIIESSYFLEILLEYKNKDIQKIAGFLTKIDSKIEQLSKKKQLLESYKKGVMQKIFSQELRFRDDEGGSYLDWEEMKLGDIAKIYDGTHATPDYKKEGIPFYSVEHLTSNNFLNTKFISKEVFEKENKRVKLEKEDVLMTRIGNIGTSKYIDWDVNASFYVSLALIKKSESNNTLFINQYIKSSFFQKELHKRIIHVAFPKKINLGEISYCLINTPSLTEQVKIADFLTKIDKKINLVEKQLTDSKQYKKGLLQQMFI